MASLIEGFEYDIFISYRQKDNKHDGWVTEFVNNLKGELESTFKEEISVYFDINPHDGLLETHDVDASLRYKLKCLVFIPVISRTYCDPKSFAWEHEFKAFLELASKDQYGLKIKLPGGNVANRVLPIQIHDLDTDDKKLVENELGGFLRGVEFIYKEPGVDRPLTIKDNEEKNLNKTNYRNQINKVALAIKEIITGLKNHDKKGEGTFEIIDGVKPSTRRDQRTKIFAVSLIILAIIVAGYFIISNYLKPKEEIDKSIAVLPFKLLSEEPNKQYLADGMMDAITLHLSKIKELRVMSRTSVEQFRQSTQTTKSIGRELDVKYLLEGSFQKFGDSVRLIVQLIKTGKEGHIWANNYDRSWNNVFAVQSEVAQAIARELQAVITPEEKHLIEKSPTNSLTALDFYQRGRDEQRKYNSNNREALKRAEDLYHKALRYDSTFALAYTSLAMVYWSKQNYEEYFSENYLDSVRIFCDVALSYDNQLSDAYTIKGEYYRTIGLTTYAEKEYDNALKFNPNDWLAYRGKGLSNLDDLVKQLDNFHKAVSLNHGPELSSLFISLGSSYLQAGFFEKSKYYFQKAYDLDGNTFQYLRNQYSIEYFQGHFEKAGEFLGKIFALDTNNIGTLSSLGFNYMFLGMHKESLKYFEKWFNSIKSVDPVSMGSMHRIGYAYWKNGNKEEAKYFFDKELEYCNRLIESNRPKSRTFSAYYDLAGVYAFRGEKDKAYENLRIFNQRQVRLSWVMYIKNDPLFDSIKHEPEFQQIVSDIESRNQSEHKRVEKWLDENNLI